MVSTTILLAMILKKWTVSYTHLDVYKRQCFSGAKRDGDMLASARGVAIKVKQATPVGNIVV